MISFGVELTLTFLGVDWPYRLDPGEGGRGDC